jgi:hypothetical protein
MATPQTMLDHEAVHKHPMVMEILTEWQTMDNKARIDARFSEGIEGVSYNQVSHQNEDKPL